MRTNVVYHAVDSHTEGMPTRVIVGGVGLLPGATMAEKRLRFMAERDGLRTLLMTEPRGHASMSGAILQPPTRPDADLGVIYIEVSGCLPMCGHGTIGVVTVAIETGLVTVTEPETVVRLDTPAGLVVATARVRDGKAVDVTLRNVPSYAHELDAVVQVPGYGQVRYDIAYGGNFYATVALTDLGIPFQRNEKGRMVEAGLAIMQAINTQRPVMHPTQPEINECHHVYLEAPDSTPEHGRHAMAIHPGWFDRSPCGTGTSARLARLHARGLVEVGQEVVNESFIGSRFTARVLEATMVGDRPGIVPSFTGRAWVTGTAQYMLDPTDPFPVGFLL